MEQKDYLMREIEKIGLVLRAAIGKLLNTSEIQALPAENPTEKIKEMLLDETGFDMNAYLILNETDSGEYLLQFKGMNPVNCELLADIMVQFGNREQPVTNRVYFEKALQLYEFCKKTDRTYSFDRERKILEIIKQTENHDPHLH